MESLARELVENLGGLSNIKEIENCITRIRVSVKSLDKVNTQKIKMLEEVIQIVITDTVQIILGPGKSRKIKKVMNNFEKNDSLEIKIDNIKEEYCKKKVEIEIETKGKFKNLIDKIFKK
ncbi:MAG: PTS transporter subunit EIIB [Fusobacteriaceae bacterium]